MNTNVQENYNNITDKGRGASTGFWWESSSASELSTKQIDTVEQNLFVSRKVSKPVSKEQKTSEIKLRDLCRLVRIFVKLIRKLRVQFHD